MLQLVDKYVGQFVNNCIPGLFECSELTVLLKHDNGVKAQSVFTS